VASIALGLPFTKRAFTSRVTRVPSSSTRNMPVMSPMLSGARASGSSNTNIAWPVRPSRLRVRRMSGTTGSFTPRKNWMAAAACPALFAAPAFVSSAIAVPQQAKRQH
jgi:hypothetical protein